MAEKERWSPIYAFQDLLWPGLRKQYDEMRRAKIRYNEALADRYEREGETKAAEAARMAKPIGRRHRAALEEVVPEPVRRTFPDPEIRGIAEGLRTEAGLPIDYDMGAHQITGREADTLTDLAVEGLPAQKYQDTQELRQRKGEVIGQWAQTADEDDQQILQRLGPVENWDDDMMDSVIKKILPGGEEWSQPFIGPMGNLLRRNLKTNKTEKVTGPVSSFALETDPKTGRITGISYGPGVGLKGPMERKVQQKMFDAGEQMTRLKNIKQKYYDFYTLFGYSPQTFQAKWGNYIASIQDKFGGTGWTGAVVDFVFGPLTEKEKKELGDHGEYQQAALENINLAIQEMTGAQMSQFEAGRIRRANPDPGENVFSGDSPIQFERKLNARYKELGYAVARYNMLLKQGFSDDYIEYLATTKTDGTPITPEDEDGKSLLEDQQTLEQTKEEMNKWGANQARQIKAMNPRASEEAIKEIVHRRMEQEFFTTTRGQ